MTAKALRDRYNEAYNARFDPKQIEKHGKNELANREHYAFARSLVNDKPWMAPSVALATPAYYLAKKANLLPEDEYTSEASLSQLASGLRGAWHGLTR